MTDEERMKLEPHERVLHTLRELLRMIDSGESLDKNVAFIRKGLENALSWEDWLLSAPNDLKLSDSGVRRGTCMVCGKAAVEAGAVTHGAVRCSAWLGVADDWEPPSWFIWCLLEAFHILTLGVARRQNSGS